MERGTVSIDEDTVCGDSGDKARHERAWSCVSGEGGT